MMVPGNSQPHEGRRLSSTPPLEDQETRDHDHGQKSAPAKGAANMFRHRLPLGQETRRTGSHAAPVCLLPRVSILYAHFLGCTAIVHGAAGDSFGTTNTRPPYGRKQP